MESHLNLYYDNFKNRVKYINLYFLNNNFRFMPVWGRFAPTTVL